MSQVTRLNKMSQVLVPIVVPIVVIGGGTLFCAYKLGGKCVKMGRRSSQQFKTDMEAGKRKLVKDLMKWSGVEHVAPKLFGKSKNE